MILNLPGLVKDRGALPDPQLLLGLIRLAQKRRGKNQEQPRGDLGRPEKEQSLDIVKKLVS